MNDKHVIRISVCLTPGEAEKLRAEAKREQLPLSTYIRRKLNRHLYSRGKEKPNAG